MRTDIEVLQLHGLVKGPITAWPLPWGQISANLRSKNEAQLPVYVRRSLYRVRKRLMQETLTGHLNSRFKARASLEPALVRGFATVARDEIDSRLSAEYMGSRFTARLSFGYQGSFGFNGGNGVFHDSYAAFRLGNWLLYGGLLDTWWSPGWQSSLILSNNARPYPKIGLMRYNPTAFDLPILRWLGPWQVNADVGVLEESDRFIDQPLLIGLRGAINPLPGLEITAARTLQFCGDSSGRVITEELACGFDDFLEALSGRNQPGSGRSTLANNLGGFSVRYSTALLGQSFAIYGQVMGEDHERAFGVSWPAALAGLFGLSLWGGVGDGGLWRVTTEYSDSTADFHESTTRPNLFYEHFQYRTGYRYRGRSLGHTLDNDSRLFSIIGTLTDLRNWTYRLAYHHAKINRDGRNGAGVHSVSQSAEDINILEAGLQIPWRKGNLAIGLRLRDNGPDSSGTDEIGLGAEIAWSVRF